MAKKIRRTVKARTGPGIVWHLKHIGDVIGNTAFAVSDYLGDKGGRVRSLLTTAQYHVITAEGELRGMLGRMKNEERSQQGGEKASEASRDLFGNTKATTSIPKTKDK